MTEYTIGPVGWQAPELSPRESVICWEIEQESKHMFEQVKFTEELTRSSLFEIVWADKKSKFVPKLSLIPVSKAYGHNINVLQRLFPDGRTDPVYVLHKAFTPKDNRVIFTATEVGAIIDVSAPVGVLLKKKVSFRHPHFEYELLEMADGSATPTANPLIALIEKEIDHSKDVPDEKSSMVFWWVGTLDEEDKFELFKFSPFKFKYPAFAAVIPYEGKTIVYASCVNTTSSFNARTKGGIIHLNIEENGQTNHYELAPPGYFTGMYDLVKRLSSFVESTAISKPVSAVHPENMGMLGTILTLEATRRIADPSGPEISLHELYGAAPDDRLKSLSGSLNANVFPKLRKVIGEIPELNIDWSTEPVSEKGWAQIDSRIPVEFASGLKWELQKIEGDFNEGEARVNLAVKAGFISHTLKWSSSREAPLQQFENVSNNIESQGMGVGEPMETSYGGHAALLVQGYKLDKGKIPSVITSRLFRCDAKGLDINWLLVAVAARKEDAEKVCSSATGQLRCHRD